MNRKRYNWIINLQRDDGQVVEHRLSTYWDPEQEGCNEAVMRTAKGEAFWASGKKYTFHPLAAKLIET